MMIECIIILLALIAMYHTIYNVFSNKSKENFSIMYPMPEFVKYTEVKIPPIWEHPGKERHAKLNSHNGVEYVDDKPPCARGEYGCRPVSCPAVFEDKVICWKCEDIIAQPEYEGPDENWIGRHY